jgi:hypothetical protein
MIARSRSFQRPAEQHLIGEGAVDLGGVEEVTPSSRARWMVATDSVSSKLP